MKISGFCVEILNRMAEQNDRELDIVDIDAEMEEIDAVNWEEFVIMTAYILVSVISTCRQYRELKGRKQLK